MSLYWRMTFIQAKYVWIRIEFWKYSALVTAGMRDPSLLTFNFSNIQFPTLFHINFVPFKKTHTFFMHDVIGVYYTNSTLVEWSKYSAFFRYCFCCCCCKWWVFDAVCKLFAPRWQGNLHLYFTWAEWKKNLNHSITSNIIKCEAWEFNIDFSKKFEVNDKSWCSINTVVKGEIEKETDFC